MKDFAFPLIVLVVLFAVVFALAIYCGHENNDKFNRFANACNGAGGQLSVTYVNDDGNPNYECFKNYRQIQVPGFPGY